MTALQTSRKTIRSGWLDKVMQVAENGKTTQSYSYDISGQLAIADYGDSKETFLWDGLALLSRNNLKYVNEPAVTGGNPILAGDKVLFDDMLGNTLGVKDGEKFSAIDRDAFGELKPGEKPNLAVNFFTGKPEIDGLGYSFLFRNYRADLGKWQTTDPLGYPNGWNNLAYCDNNSIQRFDSLGGKWGNSDFVDYYYKGTGKWVNTDTMGLTSDIYGVIESAVLPRVKSQIDAKVAELVKNASSTSGGSTTSYTTSNSYSFGSVCFSLGDGSVDTTNTIYYGWSEYKENDHTYRAYSWNTDTTIIYSDIFEDPLDIGIELGGNPYPYGHIWQESLTGSGKVLIE